MNTFAPTPIPRPRPASALRIFALRAAVAVVFALLTSTLVHGQISFNQVTTTSVSANGGSAIGAAWGDFNRDGFPDLFINRYGSSAGVNLLHQFGPGGTATLVTGVAPVTTIGFYQGSVWGDFDNDGWLDLFVSGEGTAQCHLYRNNTNGTFTEVSVPALATSGNFVGGAWCDFDRDGKLDLFVPRFEGPSLLLRNLGGGAFANVASTAGVNIQSRCGVWGDFDNDGWPDLFSVKNSNTLYRNNGNGTFTSVSSALFPGGGGRPMTSAAWGDYDNDGFLDLAVTYDGAIPTVFHNNGNGTFRDDNLAAAGTVVGGLAWADFDNDGWLDLIFSNNGTGLNAFRNGANGTFSFSKVAIPAAFSGGPLGVSVADYDRDGQQDVAYAINNGNALLLRNSGTLNSWLTVRPTILTNGGGISIGARVTVRTTISGVQRVQTREISGGSGSSGQNFLEACFGLGSATLVDSVEVTFPSGTRITLQSVAVRQFLEVGEVGSPTVALSTTNLTENAGSNMTLSAFPGGAPPFGYQWRFNGTNLTDGAKYAGTRTSSLTVTNFQLFDSGGYSVVVTNGFGAVTSAVAVVELAGINSDTDGDGLPDAWEIAFGLNLANATDANTFPPGARG